MDPYLDPIEGGPGPDPNVPPPYQPPDATPPPAGGGLPKPNIPLHGLTPPQALIDVFWPGFKVEGDQLVFHGDPNANVGVSDPEGAYRYIKTWAEPLAAKNYKSFFNALYNGSNARQELLIKGGLADALKAAGFNVTPANQQGQISKIQTPDGKWVRVITGDPQQGGTWDWVEQPPGGGGGGPANLGDPFGSPFTPPGDLGYPDMPEFHAPTFEDMLKDRGYQFRTQQGQQGLEQSAAARGVLNTGGTLKDILNYGQSAASQEFGNVWNRNLDAYDRAFRGWSDQYGFMQHRNDTNWQHAYDKWLQDYNIDRNYKNDTFDHNYKLA